MPRGDKPLQRKTALPPGPPLARGGGLARTAPMRRPLVPAPRKPARYTGPSRTVHDLLDARDGGVCVICGQPGTDWDPLVTHHRKDRGMGGSKNPAINATSALLRIHASENHGLEDDTRGEFYAWGWKLRDVAAAPTTPVLYPSGRWYLLDDEGQRKETVPPPRTDQ